MIKRLLIKLDFDNSPIEVGELIVHESKVYFKYYPSFIDKGLDISPFKLPLVNDIQGAQKEPFDGVFGLFNDSLPDGWGRLLLDRKLSSKGINIFDITPLDRLSYVGKNGIGALTYHPSEKSDSGNPPVELDIIANEMKVIMEGFDSEILDELYKLGGSSGGARPKIFAGYNSETNHIIHGDRDLPENYEHWIIKFPSSSDPSDIANIEYAYYLMAKDAGIEMSESRLLNGRSGRKYFGTRRFDRPEKRHLHMHSASGLMHDNFRLSNMDYGHLMDCAFRLENHVMAYEKVLRLAIFNVFGNNRDDHSKNFSFLMNKKGEWKFAPAYDLTFSYSTHGHHNTMVSGESKNPGTKHIMELAELFGVKKADKIISDIKAVTSNWKYYAEKAEVGKLSAKRIGDVLKMLSKM